MEPKTHVNIIGDVHGSNIAITQVYAPAAMPMQPRRFIVVPGVRPFSVDWLVYSQRSTPFFGRDSERSGMLRFLEAPQPFLWWVLTGDGGSGKSRFALELTERLPVGWTGGFLRRENTTARDAAAWTPESNHLWVVDYAASHHAALREIIAIWSTRNFDPRFKVRLLLLERHWNSDSGWGAELTSAMYGDRAAVTRSQYSAPGHLSPLLNGGRAFLEGVARGLPDELCGPLLAKLSTTDDTTLFSRSGSCNPLLLLLLAADWLARGDREGTPGDDAPDTRALLDRHLERELDLIRHKCDAIGLAFQSVLSLLFVTTSSHPLWFPQDHDILVLNTSDDHVLLIRGADGLLRLPTFGEARDMGLYDVDKIRADLLRQLASCAAVQDVELYLEVLAEAGVGRASGHAILPDVVGETFIRLMLGAPGVGMGLRRRRGEIGASKVARLIEGAMMVSNLRCTANWARLEDSALASLLDHLKRAGKSIRFALVAIRAINLDRSVPMRVDRPRLFAAGEVHSEAPEVGAYVERVTRALTAERRSRTVLRDLTRDRLCWTMPYVDILCSLTARQRLGLAVLLCRVEQPEVLSRLTNLSNFLIVINSVLGEILDSRAGAESEAVVRAELVELAMRFVVRRARAILTISADRANVAPYRFSADVALRCGHIILNNLLGRQEGPATRAAAVQAVTAGMDVLRLAGGTDRLQYHLERERAALLALDSVDADTATKLYVNSLGAIVGHASASAFTDTLEEALRLQALRWGAEATVRMAAKLLSTAPPGVALPAGVLAAVVDALIDLGVKGHEPLGDEILCIAESVVARVQSTDEEAKGDLFSDLLKAATNAARTGPRAARLRELLRRTHASAEEGACGLAFERAVLATVAGLHALEPLRYIVEGLPFRVWEGELPRGVWEPVAASFGSEAFLRAVKSVRVLRCCSQSNREKLPVMVVIIIGVHDEAEAREHAEQFAELQRRVGNLLKS